MRIVVYVLLLISIDRQLGDGAEFFTVMSQRFDGDMAEISDENLSAERRRKKELGHFQDYKM